MQRKHAFLLAGFLTAAVTTALLSVTGFAFTTAETVTPSVNSAPAIGTSADQSEDTSLAREAALQAQLAQGRQALLALDGEAQPRLAELQADLAGLEQNAVGRAQAIEMLQAQIVEAQVLADQEAAAYAQDLGALQATETQMRQQLDAALAELQAAYGEIATRQAATANSASDTQQGNHAEDEEHDEHDEHEEHEEHGDGDDD